MTIQRSPTAQAARYLPFLLAAILAGCGSSGPGPASDRSVAGVRAAAQKFVADLQHGNYSAACDAFTAKAHATLTKQEPGGCIGSIPFLYGALGGQITRWFNVVLPNIQVQGDVALSKNTVQARYEHGRWHLETAVL